jgi:hypothetical protein
MSTTSDSKIRPIVWLMGLSPFVVVAAIFVVLLRPEKRPAKERPAATTVTPPSAEVPAPVAAPLAPPTPAASPPPPVPFASALAALGGPAPSGSADERKEIDALMVRPPGSEQWTLEQKNVYRAQLLQDLQGRERKLEREISIAHRSGDKATEQAKKETLAYVQRMDEVLEAPLSPAPPTDAGLAD